MFRIMAAEVALNRAQDLRIVIHRQHYWLWHSTSDEKGGALVTFVPPHFVLAQSSRYNFGLSMSSPLASAVADLSSSDPVMRSAAATEIYRRGRAPADRAVYIWWSNPEFAQLFGAHTPKHSGVSLSVRLRPASNTLRPASGGERQRAAVASGGGGRF